MNINITQPGLAVDIDETLSWTIGYWIAEMQKRFGNPENLSIPEMITKYRYVQNVPYWQTEEAATWIHEQIHSNELQTQLPLIEDSHHNLSQIAKIIPIAAYMTIRPEVTRAGTQEWLNTHAFPKAQLICKPTEIAHEDGNKWKAQTLASFYPQILGIIDDNAKLLEFLPTDYQGTIFLYTHTETTSKLNVVPCVNWSDVLTQVTAKFKPLL